MRPSSSRHSAGEVQTAQLKVLVGDVIGAAAALAEHGRALDTSGDARSGSEYVQRLFGVQLARTGRPCPRGSSPRSGRSRRWTAGSRRPECPAPQRVDRCRWECNTRRRGARFPSGARSPARPGFHDVAQILAVRHPDRRRSSRPGSQPSTTQASLLPSLPSCAMRVIVVRDAPARTASRCASSSFSSSGNAPSIGPVSSSPQSSDHAARASCRRARRCEPCFRGSAARKSQGFRRCWSSGASFINASRSILPPQGVSSPWRKIRSHQKRIYRSCSYASCLQNVAFDTSILK